MHVATQTGRSDVRHPVGAKSKPSGPSGPRAVTWRAFGPRTWSLRERGRRACGRSRLKPFALLDPLPDDQGPQSESIQNDLTNENPNGSQNRVPIFCCGPGHYRQDRLRFSTLQRNICSRSLNPGTTVRKRGGDASALFAQAPDRLETHEALSPMTPSSGWIRHDRLLRLLTQRLPMTARSGLQ